MGKHTNISRITLLSIVAIVLLGCDSGAATPTSTPANVPGGNQPGSPTLSDLPGSGQGSVNQLTLRGVAMVSASEGWAVGSTYTGGGIPPTGTILHYSGGSWSAEAIPTIEPLQGIAMVSPSEGWAVGVFGLIMHYNGQWEQVSGTDNKANLNSVFMVNANEGWAVGGYDGNNNNSVILHYTGGNWQQVDDPVTDPLTSVYMVSADEGWAVGNPSSGPGFILHYSGDKWQKDAATASGSLNSVYMATAGEGWAVGSSLMHYSNGAWSEVAIPVTHVTLNSVYMTSAYDGWAVGEEVLLDVSESSILHYGGGQWSRVDNAPGNALYGVAMISPEEGWAVGNKGGVVSNPQDNTSFIAHYFKGKWTADTSLAPNTK